MDKRTALPSLFTTTGSATVALVMTVRTVGATRPREPEKPDRSPKTLAILRRVEARGGDGGQRLADPCGRKRMSAARIRAGRTSTCVEKFSGSASRAVTTSLSTYRRADIAMVTVVSRACVERSVDEECAGDVSASAYKTLARGAGEVFRPWRARPMAMPRRKPHLSGRHGEPQDHAVCRYVRKQHTVDTTVLATKTQSKLTLNGPRSLHPEPNAGGLDEQVTDSVLHAAFVPFGDLKDVNIPLDQTTQKNKGFGFVTFVETYVLITAVVFAWPDTTFQERREHASFHRFIASFSSRRF